MISDMISNVKLDLHNLDLEVKELEQGVGNVGPNDISFKLDQILNCLKDIEGKVSNESKAIKDNNKRRILTLRSDHTRIRNSLELFLKRQEKTNYSYQRKELFSSSTLANRHENKNDHALDMAESGSLDRSSKMINDYITSGQETLSELIGQKERLKGVQRQVLDIMNYLGIGNSIMKAVERRDLIDKYIVFGGMIVVLLVIYFVWYFLRK